MKRIFGHSLSLCHDLPQKTARGQQPQQRAGVTATGASAIVRTVAIKAERKPDKTKTGRDRGAARSCSPMHALSALRWANLKTRRTCMEKKYHLGLSMNHFRLGLNMFCFNTQHGQNKGQYYAINKFILHTRKTEFKIRNTSKLIECKGNYLSLLLFKF